MFNGRQKIMTQPDTQGQAATPGRLRRLLGRADFPTLPTDNPQLRKRNSVTAHVLKGILAHQRIKRPL